MIIKLYLVLLISLFFPLNAFAIICPDNFNEIEYGDSIEKILRVCGPPTDQTEYKETIRLTGGIASAGVNGTEYQSGNSYSGQATGTYNQISDEKEKVITYTKLLYRNLQPAVLTFQDGKLVDKTYLH